MLARQASVKSNSLEQSTIMLEEALHRYRLPFGVNGKFNTYMKTSESDFPENVLSIVFQDIRLVTPPEYVFGMQPGDCVSVTVDVLNYSPEYTAQLIYLSNQFRSSFVIVAASSDMDIAEEELQEFARRLLNNAPMVCQAVKSGDLQLRACKINERSRDVFFI